MKTLVSVFAAVVLFSTMGHAQSLAFKGVGGSVGYISATYDAGLGAGSESLGGFAIGAHADLGEFATGFQLIPELLYWHTSKDIATGFGSSVTWKVSDLAINGNVHYNFAMQSTVKPFVGAGLGLNFISSSGEAFGYSASTSYTRLGVNLMGGVNFLSGNMTITPELRYVLASDFNHLIIQVGLTFPMGR